MQPSSPSPAPQPPAPTADPALPAAPGSPPSPATPSAPAPTPVAVLPDGSLPLEGVPRTTQEIEGLHARREILRDQLERATNRRASLAAQLARNTEPEARAGLQQRLSQLDDRIAQIERDQALTERLIASAPPSVLARTEQTVERSANMVDEEEAVAVGFAAFGAGVLLTLVVGRLRRRFRRRRGGSPAAEPLAESERYERLAQAVDSIALEVERIGEGQRFVTQLLAERRETPLVEARTLEAERR